MRRVWRVLAGPPAEDPRTWRAGLRAIGVGALVAPPILLVLGESPSRTTVLECLAIAVIFLGVANLPGREVERRREHSNTGEPRVEDRRR